MDLKKIDTRLKKELPEVELEKYTQDQLEELRFALFSRQELPDRSEDKKKKKPKKKKKKTDFTRDRVRLVLPKHKKYLSSVIGHIKKYKVRVYVMSTGLSVKVANKSGYEINLLNYLDLRLIKGKLHGNLYFNRVKSSEQVARLNGIGNWKTVKGTFTVGIVSEDEFMSLTNKENVEYLIDLCEKSLELKKRRNARNLNRRK